MRLVVGLSGASGAIYGLRFIDIVRNVIKDLELHVVMSRNFIKVSESECLKEDVLSEFIKSRANALYLDDDLTSPLASSSFLIDAVVVIPCSLKTLSDIANSRPETLISRVAVNALRLRRSVILVLRETPLSTIDLLNALKASIAGATILPASPAFYHAPSKILDLVDFVIGKVLDVLGVKHNIYRRWKGYGATQGGTLCDQLFSQEDP